MSCDVQYNSLKSIIFVAVAEHKVLLWYCMWIFDFCFLNTFHLCCTKNINEVSLTEERNPQGKILKIIPARQDDKFSNSNSENQQENQQENL